MTSQEKLCVLFKVAVACVLLVVAVYVVFLVEQHLMIDLGLLKTVIAVIGGGLIIGKVARPLLNDN